MSAIKEYINKEEIRKLLKEGKPFTEIMTDIMKIGKVVAEKVGHKDYETPEEFFKELHEGKSPLYQIDEVTLGDEQGLGTNIFAVKKCLMGDLMAEMLASKEGVDSTVRSVMEGFQIGENIAHSFIDIGCYFMQQIRQMVISSLTVKGEYVFNYIHLGCHRGGKLVLNEAEIEAIGIDKEKVKKVLETHECIYAISFKEAEKGN